MGNEELFEKAIGRFTKNHENILISLAKGNRRLCLISNDVSMQKSNCKRCLVNLLKKGYVSKEGKQYFITPKGVSLITKISQQKIYFCGVENIQIIEKKGYLHIRDINAKTKAHRHIIEKAIGRKLAINEVIHHIDGNKKNNKINNLFLTTGKVHSKIHGSFNKLLNEIYKRNLIKFNKKECKYELC